MWIYKGEEFTSEMIEDWIGFVYIITDKSTDMKYVGIKINIVHGLMLIFVNDMLELRFILQCMLRYVNVNE